MTSPILLAWSSGKDSALALEALQAQPEFEVVGLLTAVSADYDRVSMHGVRRAILEAQASQLGLPLFQAPLSAHSSNEDYDAAWAAALQMARRALGSVQHIAYGDLFLEDVRQYREAQAVRLGYVPVFPLWRCDTADLARHFLATGHEAWVTCVDTSQLPAQFAGRRFDEQFLQDLPSAVDPCGERGEFHTCVVAGPCFRQRVEVVRGECVRRDGRFEYCDLLLAV